MTLQGGGRLDVLRERCPAAAELYHISLSLAFSGPKAELYNPRTGVALPESVTERSPATAAALPGKKIYIYT